MNERYTRVFLLQENLYAKDSPIIVRAGALLKDNESNRLVAQLKLQNISNRRIKLVRVELNCLDSLGRELDQRIVHQYLDLNVVRGDSFGAKTPIKISNANVRAFAVRIVEVGFSDNSVWSDNGNVLEPLPTQKSIETLITDKYAVSEYKSTYGNNANLVPIEHGDVWLCTCGEINHKDEEKCYRCKASLSSLNSLDIDKLRQEGIYHLAKNLCNSLNVDSLKKAIALFEKIIDYKDSKNSTELCEKKISEIENKKRVADQKRNKIIKVASIISGAVVALGLLGYFVAYPLIAKATGDFATYINMYNIEEFEIPDGVTTIESGAFSDCDSLESIVISDSVESIGEGAFYECSSLTSVIIGNGVTSIGDGAFSCCSSLTNIEIPDSVESIGEGAFYKCSSLTSIEIPDSVESIGSSAFSGCSSLESITLPFIGGSKNATKASESTLFGYIFGDYYYTDSIKTEQYYSSFDFTTYYIPFSLNNVTITGGNVLYGSFYKCNNLTSVEIGDGVTSIDSYAFYDCDRITSLVIPDSVRKIGASAFRNCSKLKIYCEVKSRPSEWSSSWNFSNRPVVWGYDSDN